MLIGEISSKSQLSRDTIRFYEKRGLINVSPSNSEYNNYKDYTEENLQQLLLIKKAKKFGFTLNEIADLLQLKNHNQASCSILRDKVVQKIEDIDRKILGLQEMKRNIMAQMKGASATCSSVKVANNCAIIN